MPDDTAPQTFDLSDFIDLERGECVIYQDASRQKPVLGSDGKPFTVYIAGPSHPKTFRSESMAQRALQMRMAAMVRAADKGGKPEEVDPQTDDQVLHEQVDHLVERTIGWSPITNGGVDFPYSPDNAFRLYVGSKLIRDQVERYARIPANFSPRRRPNS
jgi:hypothetical protein